MNEKRNISMPNMMTVITTTVINMFIITKIAITLILTMNDNAMIMNMIMP